MPRRTPSARGRRLSLIQTIALSLIGLLAVAAFSYASEDDARLVNEKKLQTQSASLAAKPPAKFHHPGHLPETKSVGAVQAPAHATAERIAPANSKARLIENFGKLPLSFEPNIGQVRGDKDKQVKFVSRGRGYSLYLTGNEAVLGLQKQSARSSPAQANASQDSSAKPVETDFIRMKLVGANRSPQVLGLDELPGKTNYLIGNDPKAWRTNVSNFARVEYKGVYPGVNLVYYGNQNQLEYDWVVEPGADPRAISFKIDGADKMHVDSSGNLSIQTQGGDVLFYKPLIYQAAHAGSLAGAGRAAKIEDRKVVDGHYLLRPTNSKGVTGGSGYEVSFQLAAYDRSRPLIIDPTLSYATYLGGVVQDYGYGIAADASGNAYVAGTTQSYDFATVNPLPSPNNSLQGTSDAFVAKIDTTGGTQVYTTFLGGAFTEQGYAIAVDGSGNAYVAGQTTSADFPTTTGAFQTVADAGACTLGPCTSDGFISKLNSTGNALLYSTYVGGTGGDLARSIAIDSAATPNIYISGDSASSNLPTSSNAYQPNPCASCTSIARAFVAKIAPVGGGASDLVYSTYLGGTSGEVGSAVAVDGSGNIYLAGISASTDFPTTTGAFQTSNNGGSGDSFLAKFNPAAGTGPTSLLYSTLLGGSAYDQATSVAADSSGNAYLTGFTQSGSSAGIPFPTKNALQTITTGFQVAFVTKINPASGGAADLVFSTYLGGSGNDSGYGIALDSGGYIYVTGGTGSSDFPTVSPIQGFTGTSDAFLTKIDPTGAAIIFSTFHGGGSDSAGRAVAVDTASPPNVYLAGQTTASNFPVTAGAIEPVGDHGSCSSGTCQGDAFISKFSNLQLPAVVVSPASLDFGTGVVVGTTTAAQTVTIYNIGDGTLNISSIAVSGLGSVKPFIIQNNTCPATLAGGANCTMDVSFRPLVGGATSRNLNISDDAGAGLQTVSLTGSGVVTGPLVTLTALFSSSGGIGFGNHLIGTTSAAKTITLTNTGVSDLTITNIAATTYYGESDNCPRSPAVLTVSNACTISITFSPTVTGNLPGSFSITDDAPFSPQTVNVSGTGIAPVPQINQPLVPEAAAAGSAGFTLTVNGTGFVSGSVVKWNGSPRATTYVNPNQLTATILATDVASAGTPSVTVVNPPNVSSISNAEFFQVTSSTSAISMDRTDTPVASTPSSVAVADFNGDGKSDMVVISNGACTIGVTLICPPADVAIYLGNGDGTFQSPIYSQSAPNASSVAVGDFNGDGIPDIVTTNSGLSFSLVTVLLGNGDGTFQSPAPYATGSSPRAVAVGDFNGDGSLDLAVANYSDQTISLLLGNGDGTFQSKLDVPSMFYLTGITAGDFNGDGIPDLALSGDSCGDGCYAIGIQLGDGTGGFSTPNTYIEGPSSVPISIATGDFTGDGILDLAVVDNSGRDVSLWVGAGDGTFTLQGTSATGLSPNSLSLGDFNGDGLLDLAVVNNTDGTASILLGNGNGTFQTHVDYTTGAGPFAAATSDFNGDGRLDLAVTNSTDNTVSILRQKPVFTQDFTSLSFPNQKVGVTSAPQSVTIGNSGSAPLTISSVYLDGTNPSEFGVSDNCPMAAPQASCSIMENFYAGFPASRPFTNIFYVTAPNVNGDRLVVGTPNGGVAGITAGLSTVPIPSFANQMFCDFIPLAPGLQVLSYVPTAAERGGDFSAFNGLLIDPTTGSPVSGGMISALATFWAWRIPGNAFGSGGLAPGATCNVQVTATPASTGSRTAEVVIGTTDSTPIQTIGLSTTGVVPVVYLPTVSLTFSNQVLGTTSAGQTVSFSNVGSATLNIASIVPSGDFGIINNTCGPTIPADTGCDFDVTFTPTALGARSGSIVITDDDGSVIGSIQTITLSGTGVAPVPHINDPLQPAQATAGGGGFILTVNGTGFVSGATVIWNGSPRATTFVNGSQLTAIINATNIATAGTVSVIVENPQGISGISNAVLFQVTSPTSTVTFSRADLGTGTSPQSIARGDFNGDGILDLAIPNYGAQTISIFLGNGDGTFQAKVDIPSIYYITGITVGDFNGDGYLDLAVTGDECGDGCSAIAVHLGNGSGGFSSGTTYTVSSNPLSIAAGDFNRDGKLDLVVANDYADTVSILIGNGDGTFQNAVDYPTTRGPAAVTVGDFNGDGILDLAVAQDNISLFCAFLPCGPGPGSVSILLGVGDGSFGAAASYPTGTVATSVVAADLNGDGKLDLAVGTEISNADSVLIGNGDGSFQTNVDYPTGAPAKQPSLGDFNGDGILDIAAPTSTGNSVLLFLGNGNGTFQSSPLTFPTGANAYASTAGDFLEDGRLDLAVVNQADNTVSVLLQDPVVSLSGNLLSFNNQLLGTSTATQTVTLTNVGSATLLLNSVLLGGTNSGDFTFTNLSCTTPTLVSGASCTFKASFTPLAVGSRTATITLTDNDSNIVNSTQAVTLTGTGTVPVAGVAPASLTFANQLVGTSSLTQPIVLSNTGTAPLTIASILASGDYAQTNNCAGSVGAGGSCTITVTFKPTATGTRGGSITITDNDNAVNGSTQVVSLTGTGIVPVAGVAPASLTFANQLVGTSSLTQPIVLSNTGAARLIITSIVASGDYSQTNNCPSLLAALTGSCTITVTFKPTATGTRGGAITITDNSNAVNDSTQVVSLTGTGIVPVAGVAPASLTFANQLVGTPSATQPIVLSNTGAARLIITSIVASGDFSQTNNCPSLLAALTGSCTITVTFTPTATGTRTGAITVTDNSNAVTGSKQVVSLTGTGTAPVAGVAPASLTFTNQLVGTPSATQPIVLSNTGTAPLTIASIVASGDYSQTNNCAGSVAAGGSCTITVTFTPTATGTRTGSITITDNNNAVNGSTQVVSLTGTGTAPVAGVAPASLTFANQLLGTSSPTQPIVLSNTGTAPLAIASIVASGDYSQTNNCVSPLAALTGNCTITVTFTPTATGARTGSITITDNNNAVNGSTQVVSLTGTGTVPVAGVAPASLTFANQLVGTSSLTQPIVLSNTGTAPLTIASILASGDYAQTNNCAGSVGAGGSCTITVTFKPTATGTRGGSITITDNDNAVNGSTQVVSLTGTGIVPVAGVAPASLTFANQLVGTSSLTQPIVLSNTGAARLIITSIVASGDYSQTNNCPSLLAALTGSCTITVTFKPTATGTRGGAITITDNSNAVNDSTQVVSLTGTGIVPVAGVAPASLTFANQLVGTPSATQPIVLSNTGAARLIITSIVASGDFSQTNNCPSLLAALTGSCTITVTFTPTATGTRTGAITVTDNSNAVTGSKQVVSLTGTGTAPVAGVAPASLTFTNQLVGTPSATQPIVLSNTGTAPLTIASIVASGDYSQTNNCAGSVAAGGSCTITVTFTPTATGTRTGSITITDNNNAVNGSTQTVNLTGTGTPPAQLTLSTSALSLPGTHINQTCTPGTVSVTNSGSTSLNISSISTAGPFTQTNTCPASLSPGSSCLVSVTFVPTVVGPGQTGTLTIVSSASSSPDKVALVADGLAACFLAPNAPAAAVLRGLSTATFTIAHQACSAAGPVHLSCSNQSPATCSFSPDVLTSPDTPSTLTVSNLQALTTDLKFEVHADATLEHLYTGLAVDLMDFQMASSAVTGTVTAGQTASYALAVAPEHGLQGTVTFSCSGVPSGASCSVTPQAVTLNGSGVSNVTVKVSTTARSITAPPSPWRMSPPGGSPMGLVLLALLGLLATVAAWTLADKKSRGLRVVRVRGATLAGALLVAMVLTWAACGGGSVAPTTNSALMTPSGTYTLTVTGTYTAAGSSTHITHNSALTLTVR